MNEKDSLIKLIETITVVLLDFLHKSTSDNIELKENVKNIALEFKKARVTDDYKDILRKLLEIQPEIISFFLNKTDYIEFFVSLKTKLLEIFKQISNIDGNDIYLKIQKLNISNKSEINQFLINFYSYIDELIDLIKDRNKNYEVKYNEISEILASTIEMLSKIPQTDTTLKTNLIELREKIISSDNMRDIKKFKEELLKNVENIESEVSKITTSITNELNTAKIKILKLEKQITETVELSFVDSLTGALNRKWFEENFEEEFWFNSNGNAACLMFDIDFFKKVNDNYGHPFGDFVLKEVVVRLKSAIRPNDKIIRYGGEEFLIILYNVSKENINQICERILNSIRNNFFKNKDVNVSVTASMGVSFFNESESPKSLVESADKNLYVAKRTGRNKYILTLNTTEGV